MKELVLKDWIWNKIAKESNAPRIWGGHVDAIFQETEKAYKVMMGAVNHTVYTWVPKSACEFVDCADELHSTKICESYEEAVSHRDYLRSCFC